MILNVVFKVSALENELLKPHNLHRWRVEEAKDPTKAQLIHQRNRLQRKLIRVRTREVVP